MEDFRFSVYSQLIRALRRPFLFTSNFCRSFLGLSFCCVSLLLSFLPLFRWYFLLWQEAEMSRCDWYVLGLDDRVAKYLSESSSMKDVKLYTMFSLLLKRLQLNLHIFAPSVGLNVSSSNLNLISIWLLFVNTKERCL